MMAEAARHIRLMSQHALRLAARAKLMGGELADEVTEIEVEAQEALEAMQKATEKVPASKPKPQFWWKKPASVEESKVVVAEAPAAQEEDAG